MKVLTLNSNSNMYDGKSMEMEKDQCARQKII